jgi:hypothetical protein
MRMHEGQIRSKNSIFPAISNWLFKIVDIARQYFIFRAEEDGVWWPPRASNPLAAPKGSGGFDSFPFRFLFRPS